MGSACSPYTKHEVDVVTISCNGVHTNKHIQNKINI